MKLLRRKLCLRPTLAGWLLIVLLAGMIGGVVLVRLHAFLAPNHPLGKEVVVIEGWLGDEALRQAVGWTEKGSYRFIVTSGGPLGAGSYLSGFKTYAELSLATLQTIGVHKPVYAVPSPEVPRDRTYTSALTLKEWFVEQHPDIHSFDLITAGPHARRSHMLYREAFGDGFDIGIVALSPSAYDASRWWTSSAGMRTVIGEAIAWVYAAFIFSPADEAG